MNQSDPNGKDPHEPGAKLDAGKPRPSLVLGGFSLALQAVTEVGTFGAKKYSDNGWKEVPNGISRYTDAMLRHYLEEAGGSHHDPETNLLHAAHLAWNALARLELIISKYVKYSGQKTTLNILIDSKGTTLASDDGIGLLTTSDLLRKYGTAGSPCPGLEEG